ncbi:hypothetical protein B7494_g2669 [Chlorociboria aeruginascens]|nr:hypothetical protein B7494_g2669 [Chlorociboria aeruginascens]
MANMKSPIIRGVPWRPRGIRINPRHHHVNPIQFIITRGISTPSETQERTPFAGPRQFTIQTPKPGLTTKSHILSLIKRARISSQTWDRYWQKHDQALVILGSTSFSAWLEDDDFLSEVLKVQTYPRDGLSITVVVAVTDAIAPLIGRIDFAQNRHPEEGFSFHHGTEHRVLPNVWDDVEDGITKTPDVKSSLTFSRVSSVSASITLPLANTLFKNGRHSTLIISKWQCNGQSFIKVKSEERTNQVVNVYQRNDIARIPLSNIPVTPLTPARRLESGLGNIVRQIDFGKNGIGPASKELEVMVDKYLKFKEEINGTRPDITVWALVIPPHIMHAWNMEPRNTITTPLLTEVPKMSSFWTEPLYADTYVGKWIEEGATFCRVLSGGGGWGTKQGLLSLDPQITPYSAPETEIDHLSPIEEQNTSALGNIAWRNSFIQFFVPYAPGKKHREYPTPQQKSSRERSPFRQSLVFGTIPSTVDKLIPSSPSPQSNSSNGRPQYSDASLQAGHFGAVSETGLFLDATKIPTFSHNKKKVLSRPKIRTKVDLPYSYFYTDLQPEDLQKSKTAVENEGAIRWYRTWRGKQLEDPSNYRARVGKTVPLGQDGVVERSRNHTLYLRYWRWK